MLQMNIETQTNGFGRKRKAKKRVKNKKWKRSKLPPSRIFQEASFDSSGDETEASFSNIELVVKPDVITDRFDKVLNLTPSKSENDTIEISGGESDEIYILEDETGFDLLNSIENTFELSSEEEELQLHDSIVEEFITERQVGDALIVSADVGAVSNDISPFKNEFSALKTNKNAKRELSKSPLKKKVKSKPFQNPNGFNPDTQCHNTKDGIVVVLTKNQTVHFYGVCLLSVLHGEIEVLGHKLSKNSPEAKLYSPRGTALLYLRNITQSDFPATKYLKILKNIGPSEGCGVVLCKHLHEPNLVFIEKHISQQILPKESNLPRVVFEPREGNFNLLKIDYEIWDKIIDGINEATKMIICGGKGVGKTTFLRYAANRLLMRFGEIRIIDLDPGQSEFTIPGCISIVRVEKPVFGTNYTHLQTAERSILSNINIAYEPDDYITNVKSLISTSLHEIPTLINYMGYSHGMGINILSAVISCVQPTDLVQISSHDSKKNYKSVLEPDIVAQNAQLFVPKVAHLDYNLYQIESLCDLNDGWTAEPRQLREMSVLAYVREMLYSNSIFRTKTPMYRINLSDIELTDAKGEKIHSAAVNATLVALCRAENDTGRVFQCLGWGIVRGIDLEDDQLVLLTSEKLETLDKITHLVPSGATLPPSVYMTPDDVTGSMPYVIEGVLMSFGQIPKRSRISVK